MNDLDKAILDEALEIFLPVGTIDLESFKLGFEACVRYKFKHAEAIIRETLGDLPDDVLKRIMR